uniref:F-box domain-containing protein n=2 Tax=Triticum urartu TaxID=4572 RepID=A0A8R7VCW3_TRIUA
MSLLTDDLVVEILSRLPLKSFCRFKCVCKYWLTLSSNPHYCKKFPRTPVGILYQIPQYGTGIHLVRLPSCDKEIDTTLSFVPCYEYLELKGCSNGLLLCYHGGITTYFADISHVIVCNPATQEWMSLPNTEPGPADSDYDLMLCFDPSWSQHFYVFSFQSGSSMDGEVYNEVKIFFSEDFTWSSCRWKSEIGFYGSSCFVNGVLYVGHIWEHVLLAIDAPGPSTQWLSQRITQLPGFPNGPEMFDCCDGCMCQSSGVLCYAQQELDGCVMRIWSLEGTDRWVVKHRLSMNNVFGRDLLLRTNHEGLWYFDYDIQAFDLERELVILVDRIAHRIISFSMSTGKGSEILKIRMFSELYRRAFYVPYYCKFPALVLQGAQDK